MAEKKKKLKAYIGLGLDPSSENFGYNIVAAKSMNDYVSVEDGILRTVKSQQTVVSPQFIASVVDDVLTKVILSGASFVVIERYHPRGNVLFAVEYVNQLIGAILCALAAFEGLTIYTPTASQWKQTVYSKEGLTHVDWFPKATVIHSADAGCMLLSTLYLKGIIPWE